VLGGDHVLALGLLDGLVEPVSVSEHEKYLDDHKGRSDEHLEHVGQQSRCALLERAVSNKLDYPGEDVDSDGNVQSVSEPVGGDDVLGEQVHPDKLSIQKQCSKRLQKKREDAHEHENSHNCNVGEQQSLHGGGEVRSEGGQQGVVHGEGQAAKKEREEDQRHTENVNPDIHFVAVIGRVFAVPFYSTDHFELC